MESWEGTVPKFDKIGDLVREAGLAEEERVEIVGGEHDKVQAMRLEIFLEREARTANTKEHPSTGRSIIHPPG